MHAGFTQNTGAAGGTWVVAQLAYSKVEIVEVARVALAQTAVSKQIGFGALRIAFCAVVGLVGAGEAWGGAADTQSILWE